MVENSPSVEGPDGLRNGPERSLRHGLCWELRVPALPPAGWPVLGEPLLPPGPQPSTDRSGLQMEVLGRVRE